jgi:endonuclease YncB( thermonuclease family)
VRSSIAIASVRSIPRCGYRNARELTTPGAVEHLVSIAVMLGVTLWLSPATADDRPARVPDSARWARVDRVSDGDTIVLMDRTRIRLHGIDAPERDQPFGDMATAALKYMVGRSVYYVETDTVRYGRMVASLYHSNDGYDINASMVCAGYAWWYERYAPDSKLLEGCQEEAQQALKGLWADHDPMPPWEWRRR